MNNELVFGLMATFGSIFAGLQLWQIKRISDLLKRVSQTKSLRTHASRSSLARRKRSRLRLRRRLIDQSLESGFVENLRAQPGRGSYLGARRRSGHQVIGLAGNR